MAGKSMKIPWHKWRFSSENQEWMTPLFDCHVWLPEIFIQSKGHAVNAMSHEITKLAIPVFSSGYMAYVWMFWNKQLFSCEFTRDSNLASVVQDWNKLDFFGYWIARCLLWCSQCQWPCFRKIPPKYGLKNGTFTYLHKLDPEDLPLTMGPNGKSQLHDRRASSQHQQGPAKCHDCASGATDFWTDVFRTETVG